MKKTRAAKKAFFRKSKGHPDRHGAKPAEGAAPAAHAFLLERNTLPGKFGLAKRFSREVLAEAAEAKKGLGGLEGRTDMRDAYCVTIDPVDAKDFDDAVSLEKHGEEWLLGVYIADVTSFVRENGPMDREAALRGVSVYLPWGVIPMLPPALSEDLCSLVEGQERNAVACIMRVGPDGEVLDSRIERGLIISRKRLDYGAASEILEGLREADPRLSVMLRLMDKLAALLRKKRMSNGSLDFDLPETRVEMDSKNVPVRLFPYPRFRTNGIIEEFMLLANRVVAAHLAARRPSIFRVHDSPTPEFIAGIRAYLAEQGIRVRQARGLSAYQEVLHAVKRTPEETNIQKKVLMSLPKARYAVRNTGHFGLRFDAYTHFTSPIRRYPDLIVHRLLFPPFVRPGNNTIVQELGRIAAHSSSAEENAMKAERDAVSLCACTVLSNLVGREFDGKVSGVVEFGIFVELDGQFTDGLVHRRQFHYGWKFDPQRLRLHQPDQGDSLGIGDRVRVKLERVNIALRRVDLRLLRMLDQPS